MRKGLPWIVHPYLLAVYPGLFIVAYNVEVISWWQPFLVFTATLLGTALLLRSGNRILGDEVKAALLVSLGLLLFFSFGGFHEWTDGWLVNGVTVGRIRYQIALWLFLMILGTYTVMRLGSATGIFNRAVNVFALSLTVLCVGQIVYNESRIWILPGEPGYTQPLVKRIDSSLAVNSMPDIYYIVADMYAGSKVLRKAFDFDNTEFLTFLRSRGFFVADSAFANYPCTNHSLASTLNMSYINYLAVKLGEDSSNVKVLHKMISNSLVVQLLRNVGYRFVLIGSGWPPTSLCERADEILRCPSSLEFVWTVIRMTPFTLLTLREKAQAELAERNIDCSFRRLEEAANIKGPKFVFAHIMAPHQPWVFDENGRPPTSKDPRRLYVGQLAWTNTLLRRAIDTILGSALTQIPVIVVQGDHGYRLQDPGGYERSVLQERFSILSAYLVPARIRSRLYSCMTPVNSFRIILDGLQVTRLGLIEDKIYNVADYRLEPYRFVDVSTQLLSATGNDD